MVKKSGDIIKFKRTTEFTGRIGIGDMIKGSCLLKLITCCKSIKNQLSAQHLVRNHYLKSKISQLLVTYNNNCDKFEIKKCSLSELFCLNCLIIVVVLMYYPKKPHEIVNSCNGYVIEYYVIYH